jgi:hypothetical protein
MFEIIAKIWFFLVMLPFMILTEGYKVLKKFMTKRDYKLDWMYVTLAALILLLVILFLLQYGYR